mgnify:CR=1 FL=1
MYEVFNVGETILLDGEPLVAARIAEEFDVSLDTVRRDLIALAERSSISLMATYSSGRTFGQPLPLPSVCPSHRQDGLS